MTKLRRFLMLMLTAAIMTALAATGLVSAQEATPLKVLTIYPQGETPLVKQFTVTFNQPMVPLGDMKQEPAQAPVSIEPSIKGRFRWLNVYTLAFEPETPLAGSLTGIITVKKGARSMSGAVLENDVITSYHLPLIGIIRSEPDQGASGLTLRPTIHLIFNQRIQEEALKAKSYFLTDQGVRIPVIIKDASIYNQDHRPGEHWTVLVEPAKDLSPDIGFEVVLPSGLVSAVGPIPSRDEIRLWYRTYGPFEVLSLAGYSPEKGAAYDPESGLSIQFSNPVLPKEALKHLKVLPEYDFSLLEEFAEGEYITELWLPGAFKPASLYKFSFLPGLKDKYGQPLVGPMEYKVAFGPSRPVLDLHGREGVIEDALDPTYPFQVRNVKQVHLRGYFLEPEQVIPFMVKHKMHHYLNSSSDDILLDAPQAAIRKQVLEIKTPANVMTFEPVKLKQLFGQDVGRGVMYFDLQAKETNHPKTGRPIYRRALAQVTSLGLSVKFGLTNTLIWTTDLKTGQPLAAVLLELRDIKNNILWRGESGPQGLAMAPGAAELKPAGGEDPLLFVMARHQDRFCLISTNWDEGISPWNFGLSARELDQSEDLMTWVLTALPLYKPGEVVNFKIIRRLDGPNGLVVPENRQIKVQLLDSHGKSISQLTLSLSDFGTASGRFTLPAAGSLGNYTIQVSDLKDRMRYAGSFQVEEYRKPTFEITIETSKKSAFSGEKLAAEVTAVYHFGSPVRNRPVDYVITSSAADFSLPRFDDYSFVDYLSDPDRPDTAYNVVAKNKLDLDQSGRAHINFTAEPGPHAVPLSFLIEATVTDVDQRTVSKRAELMVHPASFYLGLKTHDYLVEAGGKMKVDLIAATPGGELLTGNEVDLVLYRRTWQTVRRKGVGGYYNYVSKPTDEVIKRFKQKTGAQPVEMEVQLDKSGYYLLVASASDQSKRTAASAVGFYAYGAGPAGWEHYDHDRIDLIPDKKEYQPGQTAVIMVKSPFTSGTGMLTVERNGVRRHQLFNIDGPSPTLKVKMEPDDGPNVFLSVILVRGRISDKLDEHGRDPGKPAFKAGYVELRVKDDSKKLNVAVSPDRPVARPGEEIELSVKVSDAKGEARKAEVALIVADAALLQLASENVYYPEKLFFAPRSLAVWTSDLRLRLIGRRHYGLKGAPPGGGGAETRQGGFRKEFVSLAFFAPHVITDETGQVKVKFKLPDNLTTFKIFAVANNQTDMFGTGADQFKVTKPLLLKPGLPNFAGVGDEFSASVVVHNQTDKAGNALVTLAGENFNPLNSENRTVRLEPNSSLEVGFPVRVQPGTEAVFRFTVTMDDEKDAAEYRVPLRFPNPIITTATYGRLTQSARETILAPAEADKARGGLTVNVSPSLAGNLAAPFDYLRGYPYGCLEQKTSMALGDLLFLGWRERLGRPEKDAELARSRIDKYLAALASFQNYAGGYSFWPDTDRPEPYLSAYVLQTLHQAKMAGFTVDDYLFKNAQRYLNEIINRNRWPSWYSEQMKAATRSYITAVLAETGLNPAAQLELLYTQRQDLSVFGLTQLLEALSRGRFSREKTQQMEEITKLLFNRAVITSGEVHFEEPEGLRGLMSSKVRTNALALKALLWAAPDSPHLAPMARWLIRSRTKEGGHYGNTQNNALVLLALTKYIKTMEDEPPEMNVEVLLAGKSLAKAGFTSFNSPAMNSQAPMPELVVGQETPLDLKVEGKGAVYYSLHLNYALEKPNLEPYQAGMSLSRTYTRVMPEQAVAPGDSFNRGDIIRVEVTMLAPSQRHFVVLEDRLPAGLEPINFALPVAPQNLLRLLDTGNEPHEYYLRYWYEHLEIRSNRVAVFARVLREGVYTFSYLARAVTPGTYIAPGPQAEEMYSPEVYGRGSGLRLEIK